MYILGIPDTSFNGLKTRIALRVRKSNDDPPDVLGVLANIVMNLGHKST